jgi:hypothetical protein
LGNPFPSDVTFPSTVAAVIVAGRKKERKSRSAVSRMESLLFLTIKLLYFISFAIIFDYAFIKFHIE